MAKRRTISLSGAPLRSVVVCQYVQLTDIVLPSYDEGSGPSSDAQASGNGASSGPRWRSLSIQPLKLTLNSCQHRRDLEEIAPNSDHCQKRGTSPDLSPDDEYYEQSFAVHDVPSSQIVHSSLSSFFNNSLSSLINDEIAIPIHQAGPTWPRLQKAQCVDLARLPTRQFLQSIAPQTMTVDLIVAVASKSEIRSVITRRARRSIELIEMIVADESQASFSVNIWLPQHRTIDDPRYIAEEQCLRETVSDLRPRDLILIHNVALGYFRDKVNGQSLRRGMTTFDLLHRRQDSRATCAKRGLMSTREIETPARYEHGQGDVMAKVQRVYEWLLNFVAEPSRREEPIMRQSQRANAQCSPLPSDTP